MAKKITINLEVRGSREPQLYAGIHAIPDVCREVVLRGLLTLAIATPTHLVAASARNAGDLFDLSVSEGDPTITKKLTFKAERKDDALLYAHFAEVPVGRRKATVRALLMMGLLTQHAPQQSPPGQTSGALPNALPIPQASSVEQIKPPQPPGVPVSLAASAGLTAPSQSPPQLVIPDTAGQDVDKDLDELFGVAMQKL